MSERKVVATTPCGAQDLVCLGGQKASGVLVLKAAYARDRLKHDTIAHAIEAGLDQMQDDSVKEARALAEATTRRVAQVFTSVGGDGEPGWVQVLRSDRYSKVEGTARKPGHVPRELLADAGLLVAVGRDQALAVWAASWRQVQIQYPDDSMIDLVKRMERLLEVSRTLARQWDDAGDSGRISAALALGCHVDDPRLHLHVPGVFAADPMSLSIPANVAGCAQWQLIERGDPDENEAEALVAETEKTP